MDERLGEKYSVTRLKDAEGKHADCRYFVLDPQHDHLARKVLYDYAFLIRRTNPRLCGEIMTWLAGLEKVKSNG